MNLTKVALAFIVMTGISAVSYASPVPVICKLTFAASGSGAQALIGRFKMTGAGTISCLEANGKRSVLPVTVSAGGGPLGLRVALGNISIVGFVVGAGLIASPEALLGDYLVNEARGALGVGVGVQRGVRLSRRAIVLTGALEVTRGLGFTIGIDRIRVRPAESKELPKD